VGLAHEDRSETIEIQFASTPSRPLARDRVNFTLTYAGLASYLQLIFKLPKDVWHEARRRDRAEDFKDRCEGDVALLVAPFTPHRLDAISGLEDSLLVNSLLLQRTSSGYNVAGGERHVHYGAEEILGGTRSW